MSNWFLSRWNRVITLVIVVMFTLLVADWLATRDEDPLTKAVNACISQGGVPHVEKYFGRLDECQFR